MRMYSFLSLAFSALIVTAPALAECPAPKNIEVCGEGSTPDLAQVRCASNILILAENYCTHSQPACLVKKTDVQSNVKFSGSPVANPDGSNSSCNPKKDEKAPKTFSPCPAPSTQPHGYCTIYLVECKPVNAAADIDESTPSDLDRLFN